MKLSLKKPSFSIPHHWLAPNWRQEFSERRLLMLAVAILACLGVTIVGSASMSIASADFNDPFYFFRRHLIYVFMAVTASIVVANMPLSFWRRWMPVILIVAAVLLVLVLTPLGRRVNGSARWIGLGPLTIQPSEIAKFAVILYMSDYLVRRQDAVRASLLNLWRAALVVGGAVGLLMGEPDFGASLVLLVACNAQAKLPFVDIDLSARRIFCLQAVGMQGMWRNFLPLLLPNLSLPMCQRCYILYDCGSEHYPPVQNRYYWLRCIPLPAKIERL